MLKINSFSAKGTKLTPVVLPKEFESSDNLALLAQAIHVYRDRSHVGHAKVKGRGEINRTTKKWYKQKGTGGARHGARSAPIFVGGGVAHGPSPIKRELTLSNKMKKKALSIALSVKVKEGKIIALDLGSVKKTKEAASLIKKVAKDAKRITFVISDLNAHLNKVLRNIENLRVLPFRNLNAYDVFLGGVIIFDSLIFKKEKIKRKNP